ncbi:RHS repeat-associated core domain-containing protein [Pseudomonas wadenswilerensis]
MFAAVHALTPVIGAVDPRGLALRTVDYCRVEVNASAERRVRRRRFDALGRVIDEWDARLWALHEADPAVPANLRQVHSLGGRGLSRDSVDSGFACTLFGGAGQVVWSADGKGNRRELEYDELTRPVAIHEQGPEHPRTCSERFGYGGLEATGNGRGRLLRHDDPAGTRAIDGYALGGAVRAESRRFLLGDDWPDWPLSPDERDALLEPEAAPTIWRHGPLGDVLEQTDASGNRQSFGLDVAGQLNSVCFQLKDGSSQVVLDGARHDAFGRAVEEILGNGVQVRRLYRGEDGVLLRLSAQRGNGQVLQDLHYEYDPVRNVLSIEDLVQPVRHFANQRIEPRCEYRHDSLYQLLAATGWEAGAVARGPGAELDPGAVSNYRQTYRYDAGGNLLELTHVGAQAHGRTLVADAHSNRCLPAGQDFTEGFDANGNLLNLQPGQRLHWNVRNQLCEVRPVTRDSVPDDSERYRYDSAGQRLRKRRTSLAAQHTLIRETHYLPGLERHVDEATGECFEVMLIQAGSCGIRLLHWTQGRPDEVAQDQVRYALGDHVGSSSLELDAGAALISQETFHPFGTSAWWAARSEVEARYKTVRYSGKERDASGLYYYGARYYRTDWQRWLNPDPAGEIDGLNLYRMVLNNPLAYVDEEGLEARTPKQRWHDAFWYVRGSKRNVASIAPGIVRVHVFGKPERFTDAGFELGDRFAGQRVLTWLSIDPSYSGKIAARERGRGMIPLKSLPGSMISEVANTSSAEFTAFINGGFFNYKKVLGPKKPQSSSMGPSHIDGGKGFSLPTPSRYASYYAPVLMDDGSFITSGPLLTEDGQQRFTQADLENPLFQFSKRLNLPGWLSHSSHGNTRSAISFPDLEGGKAGRVRLAMGLARSRGETGSGYTMSEWAAVMSRLDGLNEAPGYSVNLDGGSSSTLGVVNRAGEVLFKLGLKDDRQIGNFIAYSR